MALTEKQEAHAERAEALVEKGGHILDQIKRGLSKEKTQLEKSQAAALLTQANIERLKAGLIEGDLQLG